MTSETPPEQPWKPVETDEIQEIRMRRILDEAVPALLEYMTRNIMDLEMLTVGGDAAAEESSFTADAIEFLQQVSDRDIDSRIYREWLGGDDILLVSFLSMLAIRNLFELKSLERQLAERKIEGLELSPDAEEFMDRKRSAHEEVDAVFVHVLERSQNFGRRYAAEDFWDFVVEQEQMMADLEAQGVRREETGQAKDMLRRLIRREFERGDREKMADLMDYELRNAASPLVIDMAGVLMDAPGMREQLKIDLVEALRLYQLRIFAGQIIPE